MGEINNKTSQALEGKIASIQRKVLERKNELRHVEDQLNALQGFSISLERISEILITKNGNVTHISHYKISGRKYMVIINEINMHPRNIFMGNVIHVLENKVVFSVDFWLDPEDSQELFNHVISEYTNWMFDLTE